MAGLLNTGRCSAHGTTPKTVCSPSLYGAACPSPPLSCAYSSRFSPADTYRALILFCAMLYFGQVAAAPRSKASSGRRRLPTVLSVRPSRLLGAHQVGQQRLGGSTKAQDGDQHNHLAAEAGQAAAWAKVSPAGMRARAAKCCQRKDLPTSCKVHSSPLQASDSVSSPAHHCSGDHGGQVRVIRHAVRVKEVVDQRNCGTKRGCGSLESCPCNL